MIRRMALATTSTRTAVCIAASGRMTRRMVEGWSAGLTAPSLRVITPKESSKVMVFSRGLMETHTKAISKITTSRERVSTTLLLITL